MKVLITIKHIVSQEKFIIVEADDVRLARKKVELGEYHSSELSRTFNDDPERVFILNHEIIED